MINWRRVPWSLWAYVALTTVGSCVSVLTGSTPIAPLIFAVMLILVWNFFLLKGLRWLWIATAVLSALSIGFDLATDQGTWHGDVIGLIGLGLLLVPATRRFFGAVKPAVAA